MIIQRMGWLSRASALGLVAGLAVGLQPSETFATKDQARRAALATAISLEAVGFRFRDQFNMGLLRRGQIAKVRLTLSAGTDYALVAAGCGDAYDVDVHLFDENGNLIDRDRDAAPIAVVQVTPKWTGTFYALVTMYDSTYNGAHYTLVTGYR
ncbi:MAG: hypothetical protein AMXMBFR64_25130 [Myxococcales bacterium]